MEEVVGHLVHEVRGVAAVGGSFGEVAVAQGSQLLWGRSLDGGRIAFASLELADVAEHVGQFHGALHLAVGGEDLIDER